jgi:hypothetical protein
MASKKLLEEIVKIEFILRLTVSRSLYPDIRTPSGNRDTFSFSSLEIIFKTFAFLWGVHSDERVRL